MDRIAPIGRVTTIGTLILTLVLVGVLAAPAFAQEQSGGAPGDWLSSFRSARSLGLGGAFVAAAEEPLGIVWNPAVLNQLDQNELHFETARLFAGTSINSFSFAVPGHTLPSVGITVIGLSSPEFEQTSELNEPLGTFKDSETAFFFSASRNMTPRLGLGMNLKVMRQSLEEFGATGLGADLGVLYDVTPGFRVGASLLNVGGPTLTLREVQESYAHEFRLGAAFRFMGDRALLSTELDQRSGPGQRLHGGGEFQIHRNVALRLGYNDDHVSGGMSFNFSPHMRLDYGLSDHELGLTHRIGFSYRFGGFRAHSDAVPPVFSPLGQPSVTKLRLQARTKAETENWSLRIYDKSEQVVREFGGNGSPPAHVMWDGKDEAGMPVADGMYTHELRVRDKEGRELVGESGTVEITTAGPQGMVPVSIPGNTEEAP
jgi:hypothetical protein